LLMVLKILLSVVPMPGIRAAIATTVAAAIRPYSMAVTPSSFFASLCSLAKIVLSMSFSSPITRQTVGEPDPGENYPPEMECPS
jgi:hypothetical protein